MCNTALSLSLLTSYFHSRTSYFRSHTFASRPFVSQFAPFHYPTFVFQFAPFTFALRLLARPCAAWLPLFHALSRRYRTQLHLICCHHSTVHLFGSDNLTWHIVGRYSLGRGWCE